MDKIKYLELNTASHDTPADEPATTPRNGFLQRLPIEVRDQIYGYVFPQYRSSMAWLQDVFPKSKRIDTSLLMTSKQIGAEAEKVLFSRVRVLFETYSGTPQPDPGTFNALPWPRVQNLWVNICCHRSLRCALDFHKCEECRGDPHIKTLRTVIEKLGEQSET